MRPHSQIVAATERTRIAMDRVTCHIGAAPSTTRGYITNGELNGKNDSTTTKGSFGARAAFIMKKNERMSGIITINWNCCASCSEFTVEPSAAHSELYSR